MIDQYIVNVEGVVVREDGRYLMIERSHLKRHEPGALTFPGGKVEAAGTSDSMDPPKPGPGRSVAFARMVKW